MDAMTALDRIRQLLGTGRYAQKPFFNTKQFQIIRDALKVNPTRGTWVNTPASTALPGTEVFRPNPTSPPSASFMRPKISPLGKAGESVKSFFKGRAKDALKGSSILWMPDSGERQFASNLLGLKPSKRTESFDRIMSSNLMNPGEFSLETAMHPGDYGRDINRGLEGMNLPETVQRAGSVPQGATQADAKNMVPFVRTGGIRQANTGGAAPHIPPPAGGIKGGRVIPGQSGMPLSGRSSVVGGQGPGGLAMIKNALANLMGAVNPLAGLKAMLGKAADAGGKRQDAGGANQQAAGGEGGIKSAAEMYKSLRDAIGKTDYPTYRGDERAQQMTNAAIVQERLKSNRLRDEQNMPLSDRIRAALDRGMSGALGEEQPKSESDLQMMKSLLVKTGSDADEMDLKNRVANMELGGKLTEAEMSRNLMAQGKRDQAQAEGSSRVESERIRQAGGIQEQALKGQQQREQAREYLMFQMMAGISEKRNAWKENFISSVKDIKEFKKMSIGQIREIAESATQREFDSQYDPIMKKLMQFQI